MNREVDYIIVGQGFAGTFFAFELIQNHKTFLIFDTAHQKASSVAAGVYNPMVLKRFSLIWEAQTQIDFFIRKMRDIEDFLGEKFLDESPVCRIFHDEHERKTWLKKAKNPKYQPYLNTDIIENLDDIKSPFGIGQVNHSGRINAKKFINAFRTYFKNNDLLIEEAFIYNDLKINEKANYQSISAKQIVFAEGKGLSENPYFNSIPIDLNKGECLNIKLENPLEDYIYKKKDFLFETGKNEYYVGATYNPEDLEENSTKEAQNQLVEGLDEIFDGNYTIENQEFGFRPVALDRRPIVGRHPEYSNLYIFNGLASRGTLLGANFAPELFQFIENEKPLSKEVDCRRYLD